MTSTSVRDVSMVMQSVQPSAVQSAQAVKDGGFTEVFNRQTSNEPAEEVKVQTGIKKTTDKTAEYMEEPVKEKLPVKEETKVQESSGEMSESELKDVEEAMEVLGSAAGQVISQIAQTFEISEDAVMQVMSEMGMEPLDVLKPDMLSNLMLEIGGAADSMELLTNEALYGGFKEVMMVLDDTLAETAQKLNVSPEGLQQFIRQMPEADLLNAQMPESNEAEGVLPIEVTVEEADSDMQTVVKQDVQTNISENAQPETSDITAGSADQNASRDSRRDSTGNDGNGENQMLAQLRENRLQPQVNQTVQTTAASFVTDMETQDIMRQIMDYMRVQIKPEVTNVEMQLHPASLGTLQVQVASEGGVLTAKFVTQSETVKAALESQMIQLQESFSQQGVRVEAIEVTVQTHQFESNLEQGRGRNQEPQERRGRVRRLILDGQLTTEEIKELNAEELLEARMMEANGNAAE